MELLHRACTELAESRKSCKYENFGKDNEIKLKCRKMVFYFLETKKPKREKSIISRLLIKILFRAFVSVLNLL